MKNRTTDVRLAELIDIGELAEHLDHVRSLRFTSGELHWLGGTYEYNELMFPIEFIRFIKDLRMPEYDLEIGRDGQYDLRFAGPWPFAIQWEIKALLIINTLLNKARMKGATRNEKRAIWASGEVKLAEKIAAIKKYGSINTGVSPTRYQSFSFSDFGTRRCFSPEWQDHVVSVLKEEFPNEFRGTSNCHLARKYELMPMGTNAHQVQMVLAALAEENGEDISQSQFKSYKMWGETFPGGGLKIILPDTFGSPNFFENAPAELAEWRGVRGDSGDLIYEGTRTVKWFRKHGKDPMQKIYIPSDGLTLPSIFRILRHFSGIIPVSAGWGSNLTNDMVDDPRFRPISIIIKPLRVNGLGVVKLSNNIAKAMGDPKDIERYKAIFNYKESHFEAPTY